MFKDCQDCIHYQKIADMLRVLEKRVRHIKPSPGEAPVLPGIDVYGETISRSGTVGGDHIIYIDFSKRYDLQARIKQVKDKWQAEIAGLAAAEIQQNSFIQKKLQEKEGTLARLQDNRRRAGVLVADVKGHDESAAFLVGMLHQAFLTGAMYEMETAGEITTHLFEILNTRFFHSSSIDDFLTMIYGEIWEDGRFEFISAGHPKPVVFSYHYNRFMDIPAEMITNYPPIGMMLSKVDVDGVAVPSPLGYKRKYTVNQIRLMGSGDILLLYTDGLMDHAGSKGELFFATRLEGIFRQRKSASCREIAESIREDILRFQPELRDDITFVLIKKR